MADNKYKVTEISVMEEEIIKKKSILNLPNNPSESGVSALKVRKAIADPSIADTNSNLAFIKRLISELNEELVKIETDTKESLEQVKEELTILINTSGGGVIGGVVPKELNILPTTNLTKDRSKQLVYIDDDGTPTATNINEMLDKKIRTVTEIPDDFQVNDFIFLRGGNL